MAGGAYGISKREAPKTITGQEYFDKQAFCLTVKEKKIKNKKRIGRDRIPALFSGGVWRAV